MAIIGYILLGVLIVGVMVGSALAISEKDRGS